MNAYVSTEELALLPANRMSYPEHHAEARAAAPPRFSLRAWFAGWVERRAVAAELEQMTDHELEDIGLSRATAGRVFDPAFIGSHR